jgi:surface protein
MERRGRVNRSNHRRKSQRRHTSAPRIMECPGHGAAELICAGCRLGTSTEPREARAVRWPVRWVLAMPLLAACAGCMPRTGIMRALLEQSEGVDDELLTEYQERPVHLQSAQSISDSSCPINKRSPSAAAAAGFLAGRSGPRGSGAGALGSLARITCFGASVFVCFPPSISDCSDVKPCAPFSTPSWPPRFPSSQVRLPRLLGRKLYRGGGPLLAWLCRVGAGRGRPIGADAVFLERSRLVCSHRSRPRPRPGAFKPVRSDGPQHQFTWAHLVDGQERNSQTKACIVYHVHLSLRHRHRRAIAPRRFVSPGSAPVHAWAAVPHGELGHPGTGRDSVGRSRVGRAAPAIFVESITRGADIGAAHGLVPAMTLPSQIATTCAKSLPKTGSTTTRKSRSLTPMRLISLCTILAAHVLLRTPCALAVTPLTDRNIRTAATAWIDKPAAATVTYGAISEWDVSAVTSMESLFDEKITFNADISKWNVARVTSLYYTFADAVAFNGDISRWNAARVSNMHRTFDGALAFNQDIGKWNTAAVTTLESTFNNAPAFNQDIGEWNTARVANVQSTFDSAAAFNQDIGKWNVASVATLYYTFSSAAAFNGDISRWNAARVSNMHRTFDGALAFNQDIGKWNTAAVATLYCAFNGAAAFNQDIGKWNVARVTTLYQTFAGAVAFNRDIGRWKTARVATLESAFNNATAFNQDISRWNVASVTTLYYTFNNSTAFNQNIGEWNTARVANLLSTFNSAAAFNQDIGKWNVASATTLYYTFNGAAAFNQDVGKWITASVTTLESTFDGATAFNQDISKWNTAAVTTLDGTFHGATAFNQDIGEWNVASVATLYYTFSGAAAFNGDISRWNAARVSNMHRTFDGALAFNRDIGKWNTAAVATLYYTFTDAAAFNQDVGKWITASVTTLESTFDGATAFNQDISKWTTTAVTTLDGTFNGATAFNQDIGEWNVASVTTLYYTFCGAAAFNQDVGKWNVACVTTLESTFDGAAAFSEDIGKWNTARVENMYSLFLNAPVFNGDIGAWNVASVTTLESTFNNAAAFNKDVSKWNTAAVTTLDGTFNGASAFNRDIGKWNVASVTTLQLTFSGAAAFNQDIGSWNTVSTTSIFAMFRRAANFNRNVARWNVLSATGFGSTWASTGALSDCNKEALYAKWTPTFRAVWPTFAGVATCKIAEVCTTCITNGNVCTAVTSWLVDEACASVTYGNIGDWNTAAVSSMASLIASRGKCAAPGPNQTMFNADIGKWNVVGVSNMAEMFSGAAAFDQPIGRWNTASLTSMASMFAGASAFDQPIGGWSTLSVANMNGMFRDASKFNQPIGGWNVAAVSDMGVIFSNAATFGQNVAAWNVTRVSSLKGAFDSTPISVSPCAVYNAWGGTLQAAYPTWRALCTECIDTIEWWDPTTNRCRQKPAVAVSGSSTDVSMIVVKTNKTKTNRGTVQVRLTSGDVDPSAPVHWTAVLRPNTPWLSCNMLNGTVDGRSSTGTFVVDADASGKKDTGRASPLRSTITVASTLKSANGSVQFLEGSDRRTIEVSVQVVAVAYLAENDITISSKEDRQPFALSRIPVSTSLTVTVVTHDCDRLPIERDQQLKLRLWKSTAASSESRNITFLYAGNGSFNAEIPGTALYDPASYQLEVCAVMPLGISDSEGAQDSTVVLVLETFDSSVARTVQGAVLGSLGVCVLAGMLFMIFRNPKKAQQLVLSFLTNEFKMLAALISDIWDIIGTLTCPILGDMSCRARRVGTGYRFVRPNECVVCRRRLGVLHLPRRFAGRGDH